jgi:PAS domain S-box-containing protein
MVMAFAVMAVVILTLGYFSYQNYEKVHRTELENQLSAVAGMKVTKLEQWKSDRMSAPSVFSHNPLFSSRVQHLFGDSNDTESREEVRIWLEKEQANSPYDRVYLLDTTGALLMSVPETQKAVATSVLEQVSGTLQSDKVIFIDFYRDDLDKKIYLAVLVPVFDDQESGKPLGVLAFQIDPGQDLYPFINEWPLPSNSADTQLIRRDGNDVVYLNGLRFNPDTALTLRIPLGRTYVPSVKAVLGEEGIVDGVDYQGEPVIAAIHKVPDTPWFLVARMDASEVYGPLRERSFLLMAIITILLTGTGFGIGMIWRDQNIRFYKEMYEVENAILKERLKSQSYLDIVGTSVISINADQIVTMVNLAGCRLLGRREEDIIGKNWFDIFLPERERGDAKVSFVHVIDGSMSQSEHIEKTIVTASGEERLVAWHITLILDVNQTITGTLRSGEDITDRKQAEEALQRLTEFQESVITNARVWMSVLDQKGNILMWNTAAEEISGYRSGEVIGKSAIWKMLYPEAEYRKQITDTIARIIRDRKYLENFETMIRSKQGDKKVISWNTKGIPDAAGRIADYIAIGLDVTDRKQAEDSLQQANKKLTLLSSITRHDINNQLTVQMGYLSLLEKKQIDPTLNTYFQKVSTAAQRISAMIRFTKEYETIGVMAPVWQETRTLVNIAAKQAQIGKVTVKNDLPVGVEVFADPLIVKVFYNLMDNAVRYGGKITTIRFSVEEREGDLILVCEDDGPGIPAEEKEKIFERGFGKNTGLGLFLSREILSITGITICETGELGKGARFEIMVPEGMWRDSKRLPAALPVG